tara:strand:- start:275 stop:418 length:144 start_codon:yes stop_codon:yes gene_type:complete
MDEINELIEMHDKLHEEILKQQKQEKLREIELNSDKPIYPKVFFFND